MADNLLLESLDFERSATAASGSLTDIGKPILLDGNYQSISMEVHNEDGTNALADFAVLIKPHKDANWHTYISGSDWASTSIEAKLANSGSLDTLSAGSRGFATIRVGPVYQVKFQAQGDGGTADTLVRGMYWRES